MLASDETGCFLVRTPKLALAINGAGDAVAALFFAHYLRGGFLETDYASFIAWKHRGRPLAEVRDCFSAAAIQSSDGAFLLGVMGAHTFNAGRVYFPCGTPDANDIIDGRVDFEHSVRRELLEETGLAMDDFTPEPGWTMVVDGSLIGQIKVLRARESAKALHARILAFLAREKKPELSDVRIVYGPGDFDQAMPRFVTAFLASRFATQSLKAAR
jgi:8-oxo-dGTP pyrophosphatase MutT (NUDIX family)